MLILLAGEGQLACEHGILKADTAQTVLDAQQARALVTEQCELLLTQARAQADGIVDTARQQASELAQQSKAQVAQMVQQAKQSIDAAARRAHDEATQRAATEWHEKHAALANSAAEAVLAQEARLAAIVASSVEAIIATEPRSALYARALRQVQTLTRGATTLTLRVHPDDAEHARAGLRPASDDAVLSCEIVADPALSGGSCIFESELGVLDASLGTQLAALRAALGRAAQAAPETDGGHGAALAGEAHEDAAHDDEGDGHDEEHFDDEHDGEEHDEHDEHDDEHEDYDEDHPA